MQRIIPNNPFPEASVLPPIPENYYKRMHAVLDALPVESRSLRVPIKRRTVILIAALIALLTIGTALAVSISLIQSMRDRTNEVISDYQGILNGNGSDVASEEDVCIPVAIGEANVKSEWQPKYVQVSDASISLGFAEIRLDELEMLQNQRFLAVLSIETDAEEVPTAEQLRLCVDGRSSIDSLSDLDPDGSDPHCIVLHAQFPMNENPLHAGAEFVIAGKLNGSEFALRYVLSDAIFESLRAKAQTDLDRYAAFLADIPGDAIQVNAYAYGYTVKEIARSGHWLYYVDAYNSDNAADLSARKQRNVPYSDYDDALLVVVDGMLNTHESISSQEVWTDHGLTRIALYRSYFPYAGDIPKESLVSIHGSIFRVNWATGSVTLPKDDAEYRAWRKESADLSATDYQEDFVASPNASCDAFTFSTLAYRNRNGFPGSIGIILETPHIVSDAHHGKSRQPVVTVNGVTLENLTLNPSEPDMFWGVTESSGTRSGFLLNGPALRTLPETFTVSISWLGSDISVTLHRSDFIAIADYTDPVFCD